MRDSHSRRVKQNGELPSLLWTRKLLFLGASLLLFLLLAEGALRLFCRDVLAPPPDDHSPRFAHDPLLGWFPRPRHADRFTGSRTIGVTNNSLGFRGPEPSHQRPGILFLGDSFVWGYDVEAHARFTEKLQAAHPDWSVYNLGVSGYGSDQECLLLKRHFDSFSPKMVFLVFCTDNDVEDNCWNFRYGSYKPWYSLDQHGLHLEGVPVPCSEQAWLGQHYWLARSYVMRLMIRAWCRLTLPAPARHEDTTLAILSEMKRYSRERGASFAVGLQYNKPRFVNFLKTNQIPFVNLETTNRFPDVRYGRHWTPEGHEFVARRIEQFLLEQKFK